MKKYNPKADWVIVKIEPEQTTEVGKLQYKDPRTKQVKMATVLEIGPGAFYSGTFVDVRLTYNLTEGQNILIDGHANMRELDENIFAMKPSDTICENPDEN